MAKKNFITRFIEGPERSEDYAKKTLPHNRWQLGWDVFKGNLGKMVFLNLLTLLFCLPLIAIIFIRNLFQTSISATFPFSQNVGIGYPAYPGVSGLEPMLNYELNVEVFKFLIIGVIFLAIAFSGGFYVIRNLLWRESVSVGADFFKGVKKNFFVVFFSLLLYSVVMVLSIIALDSSSIMLATGKGVRWLLLSSRIITYIVMAIFTFICLFMITLGLTYKISFGHLIRNAFILTIALIPTNAFFLVFASALFLILLLKVLFLSVFAVSFILFFGFSVFILIWMNYSQWIFDKFLNDRVPGAKKYRGIYNPTEEGGIDDSALVEKSKFKSLHVKPITDTEVELYELPTSFSREDLQKLEQSKQAMRKDSDEYSKKAQENEVGDENE